MPDWKLRQGDGLFRRLREEECFYADKTPFIGEFLDTGPAKGTIITRPHKFGATLNLTMMRDFFDISQDSRAIFDGLAISEDKDHCGKWMNQYPTVYANFWTYGGTDFEDALMWFNARVTNACDKFLFLLKSTAVDKEDRLFLKKIAFSEDRDFHPDFLKVLCRALYAHYGRRVILLVDSYDDAMFYAQRDGQYREMAKAANSLFDAALNDNEYLEFALLKGSLPVTGASGLDGFASCACYDISDKLFADKFGFTSEEVDDLLARTGLTHEKETIKEWYGGICFGDMEMYSPRDILGYLLDVFDGRRGDPRRFWVKTFVNAAIDSMCHNKATHLGIRLESLLSGGSVEAVIADTFACNNPFEDGEDYLWSLLYHLGHLAKACPKQEKPAGLHPGYKFSLVVPNRQLINLFAIPIMNWLYSVRRPDTWEFCEVFWANDAALLARMMEKMLDENEGMYEACGMFLHYFLYWLFDSCCKGYAVQWEKIRRTEADIVVYNQEERRIAAINVLRAGSEEELPVLAEKAFHQLKDNTGRGRVKKNRTLWTVTVWGMAFYKKHCVFMVG